MKNVSMRAGVACTVLMLTVLAWAGAASAQTTDPVDAAFDSGQTSLTAYIATGIGVIVAVLIAGLGVGLLVKYLRKAVRAA